MKNPEASRVEAGAPWAARHRAMLNLWLTFFVTLVFFSFIPATL
jgi:hypothetical protein